MSRAAGKTSVPSAAPKQPVSAPTAETEASHVTSALGAGHLLPSTTRDRMERAFGQSFGDVRVHTGDGAARTTSKHDASALTVGNNIAFAPGAYSPGTARGDHLIAHELAHVVQQAGTGSHAQARSVHSVSTEGAEQQAESAATRISRGLSAGVARGGFALSTRARVMRRARSAMSTPSAAMSVPSAATPMPGAGLSPAQPAPSPALTTQVSPGGRPTTDASPMRAGQAPNASPRGLREAIVARATSAADRAKSPDQAQTAIPKEPASPPSAMVAGAPAGANARDPNAKPEEGKADDKDGKKKKKGKDKDGARGKEKAGARGGGPGGDVGAGGGRRRARRFGHIPGDRGAGRARRALQRLQRRTTAQRHHEAPQTRVDAAVNAVERPATENVALSQGEQVGTVADSPAPTTNAAAANTSVEQRVDQLAPRDMSEMSDYDPTALRGHVNRTVNTQVSAIQSNLDNVNDVPRSDTPRTAHEAPPGEPSPSTAAPNSAAAVPPAVPDTTVDASEYREDTQAAFSEHEVSERARRNASEGPVAEMRTQEEGIDRAVDESANRVRDRESSARNHATNQLHTADEEAAQEMTAERERAETQVSTHQDQRTTEEGTDRQTVTERIEGMYNATATFVNGQISTLTQTATTTFDTEQASLLEAFKRNTRADIAAYKRERYSTPVVGWGRWLKDKFVSINKLQRVKTIYQTRRQEYVDGITSLINRLTAQADGMIALCRLMIVTTRVAIDAIVAAQGPRYAREAAEARDRVNQQFQQLERQVEAAGRQVRNALETRRERAMEAVDQALAEIQAENASLVDRLVNFVRAIYNALRQFFALMVRIEEMGIGTFLRRALDQAKSGVKNHLWNELKIAFQEWLMMKLGPLALLFNLPSNFLEILASAATNMFSLVLEALPEALPALGVAAMTWLAIQLAAKLIPGVGAIMAIIDAIRAAWSLIQSLIRAASAFFDFLLLVAGGGDGSQAFARALAWGIIAAVDALLTFLGVDSLLRRIAGPIGRPVGRIFGRLRTRLARRGGARGARRRRQRDDDHRRGRTRGDGHHRARSERSRARAERRAEGNRARTRRERAASRAQGRGAPRRDPPRHGPDSRAERRRQRVERRWRAGMAAVTRLVDGHRTEGGISTRWMRARLMWLRIRYRFSVLELQRSGQGFVVRAAMNPSDNKTVHGHVIDLDLVNYPNSHTASTVRLRWEFSRSGREHVYARRLTDNQRIFYLRSTAPNRGYWLAVPPPQSGGTAERLAREKLERDKDNYLALVPANRDPSAPGFDVASAGNERGSTEDRLTAGDAKESVARRYFGRADASSFQGSALSTNLGSTISRAGEQGPAAHARVVGLIEQGRIDFQIYLHGTAQFTERQRRLLERAIKTSLRVYLRGRNLSREEINAAIARVRVPTPVRVP
ncbi:MAG: DUF4157 domain-containing protein [Kofleriaceae bacterium]